MNETDRLLDLDADDTVEVTLGGRPFTLRQQRRALIEQIVAGVRQAETGQEDDASKKKLSEGERDQRCFESWEQSFPVYALILGFEPKDAEYAEVLEHLHTHLTFPKAQKIYDRWHQLNQIDFFFDLKGNPMVPLALYQEYLALRKEAIMEQIQKSIGAEVETTPESNESKPS